MSLVQLQPGTYSKEVQLILQLNHSLLQFSVSGFQFCIDFLNFNFQFPVLTSHTLIYAGSWDDVFKVAVALYLVGTLIWNLFSTGEKILD